MSPSTLRVRRHIPLRAVLVIAAISLPLVGLWWLSAPFRASAKAPAVAIHKVDRATWKPELGQPLFVAVIGSDARRGAPDAGGGCDAVHIVAINPQAKAGTILNFPRDSYLPAPGGGSRKITDTCRTAGFEAVVGILSSVTQIPIQFFATTEFSHFHALIEELGGIDVEVPYAMNDAASGAYFAPGLVHMNGGQALAFTRNRKDTPMGDFSRTENQGLLMLAALKKFQAEGGDAHRILDYIRAARRHVRITVPLADMIKMGLLALEVDPGRIRSLTIPGTTGDAGGASVVFLNPGEIYSQVRDDGLH